MLPSKLLFRRTRVEERSQNVVAPGAIDEQVVAGIALRDEAKAPQEPAAALIGRLIVCHDPMEPERLESEVNHRADRLRREALPLVLAVNRIAEIACLECETGNLVEADARDDARIVSKRGDEAVSCIRIGLGTPARDAFASFVPVERVSARRRSPHREVLRVASVVGDGLVDVVRLGALAGDAIRIAVEALEKRDTSAAARVIAGDDAIDDLRRKIEASCIELIWRQQPVAGELREIAAMLEIATDLERIGDYGVDIAKHAIKLAEVTLRPVRVEIDRIAELAMATLVGAMRAYTERDAELASRVIDEDDEVDRQYKRSVRALEQEMQADPEMVPAGARILFVLAELERVGDRANNIAWHTKEMIGDA